MRKSKPKKRKTEEPVEFEYLKIPAGLLKMQDINALEKDILADIAYFPNGYRIGNEDIARKLGAKHRTVVKALQRLKGKGYITDSGPNKSHRCLAVGETIAVLFETKYKVEAKANIALAKEPANSDQNSAEYRLARLLLDLIIARKPDFKRPDLEVWAKHIDLMIRIDNRNPETIEKVIRWTQNDSFEQMNVLSTEKVRKRFDQLELRMNGKKERNYGTANRQDTRYEIPAEYAKTAIEA